MIDYIDSDLIGLVCPSCSTKVSDNSKYCSNCGNKLEEGVSNDAVLHNRISYLEKRIQSLESKIPYTAILNNSFISRAFAIYGHVLVAGLIVGLPLYLIFFLFFAAAFN
jgi:uncharacterized membrane protein YvbJ